MALYATVPGVGPDGMQFGVDAPVGDRYRAAHGEWLDNLAQSGGARELASPPATTTPATTTTVDAAAKMTRDVSSSGSI